MMEWRRKLFWVILVILLFNVATVQYIRTGDAQGTKLYVDPPETKNSALGVGSTFTININIFDAQNVYGWQVNMTFNPTVVNVTYVFEGPFLKDDWGFLTIFPSPIVDNTAGYVFASCSIQPPYPPDGAYFDGTLAMITFMVKAEDRGTLLQFDRERTKLNTVVGGNVVVPITDFTTEDGSFDNRSIGQNATPVAIFDVKPLDANKRGEVNFDASGSNDPDAWLVSYHWDYGDGATEVYMREPLNNGNLTAKTTHIFNQSGTYTVTLTVTDNDGTTNSTSALVTVLFDIAIVNVESPYKVVMPGVPVTIDVTVANNGDFYETFNVTAYYNETLIELREVADLAPKTQQTLTYNWDTTGLNLGNYILKANATIIEEETNTTNNEYIDGSVTIANSIIRDFQILVGGVTFHVVTNSTSLIPNLNFSSTEKKIGFRITGEGAGGFCNITIPVRLLGGNHTVLFDGSPVTPEPQKTTNGTHTFLYFTYTTNHTVEILGETAATPPVAMVTPSKTTTLVDELISFDASNSYDPDGTIIGWNWDFDDDQTTNGVIVQHAYSAFRNYTVTLVVEDNEGYTNSTEVAITVIDYPTAKFTNSPTAPLVGQNVIFDATTSQPNGGSITNYKWDFGDGKTGTGSTVTHAYSTTGTFTVNLTITDSEELTNSTTVTVTVTIHNIAISNVATSSDIVRKGETITIEITASNKGNFTETFTVTAYFNTTAIETKSVADLSPGSPQLVTILWDTADVLPSTYTLKAQASIVTKETETEDNSQTYGSVIIQRISSSLSISASSTTLALGRNTIIHGTLDPAKPSVSITVHYRFLEGEWNTLATFTSDAQGRYILNWRPEEDGTYEVQASWHGDPDTEPCQSPIQTITVQGGGAPQTVLYAGIIAAVLFLAMLAIYFIKLRKK